MASAAQVTANQQNAMRSTGPLTDAGKETCSRNATTHGMTARKVVLSVEQQSEFDHMREAMLAAWKPNTGYERLLFEDTVRARWSWNRAQSVHTALLDSMVKEERKADPKLTPDEALARIFTQEKNAKRLRLFMRYEAAAERTYRKCKQEMERIILDRVRMEAVRRQAAAMQSHQPASPPLATPEIGSVSHSAAPQRC